MTWDGADSALGAAMGLVVAGVCSELEAFQFRSDIQRPTPSFTNLLTQFLSRQTRLIKVDISTSLTKGVATALATSSQSIRMLTCHLNPRETGVSIPEAMGLISLNCSTLEGLTTLIDGAGFSVSDLKPLFRCKTLQELRIDYWSMSSPLLENDVEAMAASWPNLEVLHLLASNSYSRQQTPLSILTTIAQCLQSTLQELGLETFADETIELETSPEVVGLSGLRHLVLGDSSTVKDGCEPDVANYLASICPPSLKISMPSQTFRTTRVGFDGWNKVAALFKHSCSGAGEITPPDPNRSSSLV